MATPNTPSPQELAHRRAAASLELQIAASDLKIDAQRWRSRRLMAWVSLISILGFGAMMMFLVPTERLSGLADVYNAICMTCGSVIAAYIGGSVWAFISSNKSTLTPAAPKSVADSDIYNNLGKLDGTLIPTGDAPVDNPPFQTPNANTGS